MADDTIELSQSVSALVGLEFLLLVLHDLSHQSFSVAMFAEELATLLPSLKSADANLRELPYTVENLRTAARRIETTISSLRSLLARLRQDAPASIALADMIEEVAGGCQDLFGRRKITLRHSIPSNVNFFCHRSSLELIFWNLAIYSAEAIRVPSPSRQEILVHCKLDDGALCIYWQFDTETVFMNNPRTVLNRRATDSDRIDRSGLSLVRLLVERLFGGTIEFHDRDSAQFEIRLPSKFHESQNPPSSR